jgi:RNA polymerase sigma-70 factor (ECF subfamily)
MEASLMSLADSGAPSLLARVAAGDRGAFTQLVEEHDADMSRLCFVICGDAELARDATQNAWHRLWRRPPRLREESKLRSWLLSVAANEARQMIRRRRRGSELEARSASGSPEPPDPVARLDLAASLARLTSDERELLALRYLLGLSSAEIAEHLRLTPEGARSRLHRLIGRLRLEMDR